MADKIADIDNSISAISTKVTDIDSSLDKKKTSEHHFIPEYT